MLYFEQINTALVCFSIVAREHKIELTQDRLVHEYGLSKEEVPTGTLLRMAKELGLKAKLLRLDWQGLLELKKAYPAIARLNNGRHVVLAGMQHGPGDDEPRLACFDPLVGAGGGYLRLSREEFETLWAGQLYVLKRVYKLTDESRPFSLLWFIPEILRQKPTFIDIALASNPTGIMVEDNRIIATGSFMRNGKTELLADIELAIDGQWTDSNPNRPLEQAPDLDAEVYGLFPPIFKLHHSLSVLSH
jgi:ABC-type bacteriocin/lantibiotic exporter with double-glycine peptidase domain